MQEEFEATDDLTIEQLSQKLEAIEKDNEQIIRENQLFESYIARNAKRDDRKMEEAIDMEKSRSKKKGAKGGAERKLLNSEQRYEIANTELQALRTNIEEGREKSQALLERLKAILEGTDVNIHEIRKEAFDFGRFLNTAESGRTGKYDAQKLQKYMNDKFRQKEQLVEKLQLKNIQLRSQICKAENQIQHKDDMGDDLKFIDFHQLQIENKKHVRDIEDRNSKLLGLKTTTAKTVQYLNGLKRKLTEAMKESHRMEREKTEKNQALIKVQLDITRVTDEEDGYREDKRKLDIQIDKAKGMPKVIDYVRNKKELRDLMKASKNWERKIAIAKTAKKRLYSVLNEGQKMKENEYA